MWDEWSTVDKVPLHIVLSDYASSLKTGKLCLKAGNKKANTTGSSLSFTRDPLGSKTDINKEEKYMRSYS